MRTSRVLCRSVWLASMTCWLPGRVSGSRRGAGQPVVRGQQLVDVAGDLHARGDQDDEVVADPLQVGDQVRGQDDAELVLGDGLHQVLEELAPGQRVEAGDRLVEDEQLGPLGDGQGQRELRALAAGELAGLLLRVEAELVDPSRRRSRRPSRG